MAGTYETWLCRNAPSYLQGPMAQAILGAYGKIMDGLISDAQAARRESLIQYCSDDTISNHFFNFHAIESPLETKIQARQYLKTMFDRWRANGSVEHMLEELSRFGIIQAKIWTWTDLMLAGIPKAFGGNWVTIGSGVNGQIRYLPSEVAAIPNARAGGAGWKVEHLTDIVQTEITFTYDTVNKIVKIHLAYNGSAVLSLARDVVSAIMSDPVAKTYLYAMYTGDGSGLAPVTMSPVETNFAHHSYYFIDIYAATILPERLRWDDGLGRWDDGISYWDGLVTLTGKSLVDLLKEVIRRGSSAFVSCRFLRVFDGVSAYAVPIANQWEEDANGNIVDFYTTGY